MKFERSATVTVNTKLTEVVTVKSVPHTVTLELSLHAAVYLRYVLGNCVTETSYADDVYTELFRAGVPEVLGDPGELYVPEDFAEDCSDAVRKWRMTTT
jgi:hypothetical protein